MLRWCLLVWLLCLSPAFAGRDFCGQSGCGRPSHRLGCHCNLEGVCRCGLQDRAALSAVLEVLPALLPHSEECPQPAQGVAAFPSPRVGRCERTDRPDSPPPRFPL